MIAQAKPTGRQPVVPDVILAVWRRQNDRLWLGLLEEDALESREPRRVQVFDDLDDGRRVEPREPAVAVHERAMDQLEARLLLRRQTIDVEAIPRDLQRPVG